MACALEEQSLLGGSNSDGEATPKVDRRVQHLGQHGLHPTVFG